MFFFKHRHPLVTFVGVFVVLFCVIFSVLYVASHSSFLSTERSMTFIRGVTDVQLLKEKKIVPVFDTVLYDKKMLTLANRPPQVGTTTATTTAPTIEASSTKKYLWPVQTVYPNVGAILPFKRVIAFYGNLLSTKMGVLGEYPEAEMFAKLDEEMTKWRLADPETEVVPALHYIAVTAQASAGADGMYRARMSDKEIDKVITLAQKRNAVVFLDVQVGLSTIQKELPLLDTYLKMPQVHFGIDPEFSMKSGVKPGKAVGTYDASDINFVAEHLAKIVRENNLPPKILVVHRYTEKMMTNYQQIKPLPEVQIVIHMDGWGGAAHKKSTYQAYVEQEPVQFAGFKLFYKNDFWDGNKMMTPSEILKLTPKPIYIQYQ
jgi:hypothetical protein